MGKKQQWFHVAVVLMGSLALVACAPQKGADATSHESSKVTSTKKASSHKKQSAAESAKASKAASSKAASAKAAASSKPAAKAALWNPSKDGQLEAFMKQWGAQMGQDYRKYAGAGALAEVVAGVDGSGVAHVLVNEAPATLGWSNDGTGTNDYNVVGVYYHEGTVPPLPNHITYFMSLHQGQPVVLVDQSRDGGPRLTVTQNVDLKNNFAKIVQATAPTAQPAASGAAQTTTDPKQIGVMLYQMAFKKNDLRGYPLTLYRGNNNGYMIGDGRPLGSIGFGIEGDTVRYEMKANDGTPMAMQQWVAHSIGLKELMASYYGTDAQRQLVQATAAQLPLE